MRREDGRAAVDFSNPIHGVIPSAHGPVLEALVRAGVPLSGRQIAALVDDRVSRSRVNAVLGELAESGLVLRRSHPPAILYELNREHVAAPSVEALANLRQLLLSRMRSALEGWQVPAAAVWMFGSAARGEAVSGSDIDVLVVRADEVDDEDPQWRRQVSTLAETAHAWSGNHCDILELSSSELARSVEADSALVRDLRRDALWLFGVEPAGLLHLGKRAARS